MTRIIPRNEWGFNGWSSTPGRLDHTRVGYVTWHYEGANPVLYQIGVGVPRSIHAYHKTKWAGIGYNYVIDAAGNIYEGRGLAYRGAHKPSGPGQNSTGFGVQLHLGGSEQMTPAMEAAGAWLKTTLESSLGKQLTDTWHGEGFGTACPGANVIAWVRRGGPDAAGGSPARSNVKGSTGVLDVDGLLGPATVSAWQKYLQIPATGMLTRDVVRNIQSRWLQDPARSGRFTTANVRVLQEKVSAVRDGVWGPNTTAGLQRFLNKRLSERAAKK